LCLQFKSAQIRNLLNISALYWRGANQESRTYLISLHGEEKKASVQAFDQSQQDST